MSNYNFTPTKKYSTISTSVTYNLQRTQHARYAGAFITYYHTKFHMSISSNSLVTATQQNSKGISHDHQVNLTIHKVFSISVAHCVMLSRTLHYVKYYTNILTSWHITFTLRREHCRPVYINQTVVPQAETVKLLALEFYI